MGTEPSSCEQARIRRVYADWLAHAGSGVYAWHRPEILDQGAAQMRTVAGMLLRTVGADLSQLRVVDVGCGSGTFLRQLVNWGADPARLAGTEYQQVRLDLAQLRSPAAMRWHLGDLDFAAAGSVDLVSANTVLSSVIDPVARAALAAEMWRVTAPGGWCMVFDFRYNNPRNVQVRRVTRAELERAWPAARQLYRTLLLAPPLARRLAGAPRVFSELLTTLAPPLRSHFIYMAQKPA